MKVRYKPYYWARLLISSKRQVYMNTIQAFVPLEIIKTFATFLEFYYVACRNVITDDSLNQLSAALRRFHESRQVFSGTVREDGLLGFSLPRQHSMVHYYDHIKNFGSPNGLCSSITESKHITAVKRPWRRSNKHTALPQMLKANERLDKLAAARADFTARGMLTDSCLIHAIRNITDYNSDNTDEDASDSDETDDDEIFITSSELNGTSTQGLTEANTSIPDNTNDEEDPDMDIDHPHMRDQHSPTPPDDNEDDDHGPVESVPLMNEVRLVSKKGWKLPSQASHSFLTVFRSTHKAISHIIYCARFEDQAAQSSQSCSTLPVLPAQPHLHYRPR